MQSNCLAIAGRLRQVRVERHGEDGLTNLAEKIQVHARTWENYENGVTITGLELLKFIVHSNVNPQWLLTGLGDRYEPVGSSSIQAG